MEIAMIQDRIVPFAELDAAHLDRGTFFGDGVYEVMRSYDGRIFVLDEHMDRFSNSLSAIAITAVDIKQVRDRVSKAFETAGIANAEIYFHVTRGSTPRSRRPAAGIEPNFFLTITELPDYSQQKQSGISVSTFPDWRWKRCDIKSLNLLANVLARQDAGRKGCDEAILVDQNGLITEGAGSAFFAVFQRSIQTAPLTANILSSITRKYVIKSAQSIAMTVVEESMTPQQALQADELFIAVTTRDIISVVRFDDNVIGDGKPGKCTRQLIEQFAAFTK